MEIRSISNHDLNEFKTYLMEEEKSAATVEKYLRDGNGCCSDSRCN